MWAVCDHHLSSSLVRVVPGMSLAFPWESSPSCWGTSREAREHLLRSLRAFCGHIPFPGHMSGGAKAMGLPCPMLS